MKKTNILIVDDDEDIQDILSDRLKKYEYQVFTASDGIEAIEKIEEGNPELVLLDIMLPGKDGIEVLNEIKNKYPEILVIMITAYGTIELAVESMKQGAYDFIEKPFDPEIVIIKVDKALERQTLIRENKYLRSELKGEYDEIIGKSKKIVEVLRMVEKIAPSDSNVLITGESGTGKELIARALHRNSPRSKELFRVLNCAAIQPTLLESELFGYEKGAFTGATTRKLGIMELADGGILFLDEIGDMASELQAKLLRAIQFKEFERVGGTEPIKVNIRFIAATNQDLHEAIQGKKFRSDLFYRLSVLNIHIPPLRERKEDIPLLTEHFLKVSNNRDIKISDEAMELLKNYRWPGNIRELRNHIERITLLSDSKIIRPEDLPEEVILDGYSKSVQEEIAITPGTTIEDIEKALILKTLEEVEGNKTKAAELLGICLKSLYNKVKKYDI